MSTLRLDKWLWYARFFKSGTLAAKVCTSGRLRINGTPVAKAHHPVRQGDVLTFPKERHIRVISILALGSRRGPAAEARALYDDLDPPRAESRVPSSGVRERRSGRPTKAQRRALARLKDMNQMDS